MPLSVYVIPDLELTMKFYKILCVCIDRLTDFWPSYLIQIKQEVRTINCSLGIFVWVLLLVQPRGLHIFTVLKQMWFIGISKHPIYWLILYVERKLCLNVRGFPIYTYFVLTKSLLMIDRIMRQNSLILGWQKMDQTMKEAMCLQELWERMVM